MPQGGRDLGAWEQGVFLGSGPFPQDGTSRLPELLLAQIQLLVLSAYWGVSCVSHLPCGGFSGACLGQSTRSGTWKSHFYLEELH